MTLLAIAFAWLGGVVVARALDPRARGGRLLGAAFPLGIGTCALAMGALSALGVAWTRASALGAAALAFAIAAVVAAVRRNRAADERAVSRSVREKAIAWAIYAVVAAMVMGHGLFATLAPPGEWDFWAIWGLKGKVFHESASIEWAWLERPANEFAHPDYPLLLPLAFDFAATLAGAWPERELGLLFTAFAASALIAFASHLRASTGSPLAAALGALAITGPLLSVPVGLADLPLLVYGGIALLELRRSFAGRAGGLFVGGAALVLAALTKNEGIALTAATALALLAAKEWRRLGAVAPAAAAGAIWIAIRSAHGLGTDLFAGDPLGRLAAAAAAPGALFAALGENPPDSPLFWLAVVLAIALAGRRLAGERFLAAALAVQLAFFVGAYLLTPRDVAWHVETSWPRLVPQLLMPAAFLAVLFAFEVFRGTREMSSSAAMTESDGLRAEGAPRT